MAIVLHETQIETEIGMVTHNEHRMPNTECIKQFEVKCIYDNFMAEDFNIIYLFDTIRLLEGRWRTVETGV